ncbi:hypothetical protein XAR_2082 [Xanthomonas citri pv. glycines str. 8ra]|nr:hypothetical protein XAR_2082 [Xanthomonas citri pv. glycines str. 8ra]
MAVIRLFWYELVTLMASSWEICADAAADASCVCALAPQASSDSAMARDSDEGEQQRSEARGRGDMRNPEVEWLDDNATGVPIDQR